MISVIIPTYKEEGHIGRTLRFLRGCINTEKIAEIIVADGGSPDDTRAEAEAEAAGARVLLSPKKGRAAQSNFGAVHATAGVLYFLHADTLPPPDFISHIDKALERGAVAGCFRLTFDHPSRFLAANCWFTRFDVPFFRFGDQSLFVTRAAFEKSGGFDQRLIVMEDQDLMLRLRRIGRFAVMPAAVVTSARKYVENGVYRMQGIFFLIYFMYYFGAGQQRLLRTFRRLVRQDKL